MNGSEKSKQYSRRRRGKAEQHLKRSFITYIGGGGYIGLSGLTTKNISIMIIIFSRKKVWKENVSSFDSVKMFISFLFRIFLWKNQHIFFMSWIWKVCMLKAFKWFDYYILTVWVKNFTKVKLWNKFVELWQTITNILTFGGTSADIDIQPVSWKRFFWCTLL